MCSKIDLETANNYEDIHAKNFASRSNDSLIENYLEDQSLIVIHVNGVVGPSLQPPSKLYKRCK